MCDSEATSQLFSFDDSTGEVMSSASYLKSEGDEANTKLCLGWNGRIQNGRDLLLRDCDGRFVWDESFYKETSVKGPVHGE